MQPGERRARPAAQSRGRQRHLVERRLPKVARRHRHSAARALPARVSEVTISSLPHLMQRMPEGQPTARAVPRQILVLVDQYQPRALGHELARTYGLQHLTTTELASLGARAELMRVREGRSEETVLAALQNDGRIRSAQLNWRYLENAAARQSRTWRAEADPRLARASDPQFGAAIPQYAASKLGLAEAHALARGRNVLIAVIDSRIDTAHPSLEGAVAASFDAAQRPDTAPDYHGTAVAGIIRGHGLVEGAAPDAKLLAVRAFRISADTALPETTTHVLLSAIDWAVGSGAKVLNMSFVGGYDPAVEQLLQAASERGVILVAAAGNGGPAAPPVYPAAYARVIAVTAVDEADRRYEHANRGGYIALAAPGVNILAPVQREGYAYVSGTSFAAAYVSAIAALLLERDPTLDPQSLADLLATGAEHLGPAGRNDEFGAGRVNAFSSLKLLSSDLTAKRY
jgi:subtilisin family serine protease